MSVRRRLGTLVVIALLAAGCGNDVDKEMKEFKEFSGIPSTSPQGNLGGRKGSKTGNAIKSSAGKWYKISSLENDREIRAALRVAGTVVPEIGYWLDGTVRNGNPWHIWDNPDRVPENAFGRTEAVLVNDKGISCNTYLDMEDIHTAMDQFSLSNNFVALLLVHEASHCQHDTETEGVQAEQTFVDRTRDESLQQVVDNHIECLTPSGQWKNDGDC